MCKKEDSINAKKVMRRMRRRLNKNADFYCLAYQNKYANFVRPLNYILKFD